MGVANHLVGEEVLMTLDVMGRGWWYSQYGVSRQSSDFSLHKELMHNFSALVSLEAIAIEIYREDGFQ